MIKCPKYWHVIRQRYSNEDDSLRVRLLVIQLDLDPALLWLRYRTILKHLNRKKEGRKREERKKEKEGRKE